MTGESAIGAAGGAALMVCGLALWILRRQRQRREVAHELQRLLLARLLEYVRYMPGVSEREIEAVQAWLRSRRRFGGPVPYDQDLRLRRLLAAAEPDQRRRALLAALDGPCVRIEEGTLGVRRVAEGPLVEQIAAWLDSDPLDPRIGAALAAAGCRIAASGQPPVFG